MTPAHKAALGVIGCLEGRGGFDAWWDDIDRDIQAEIVDEIAQQVEGAITVHLSLTVHKCGFCDQVASRSITISDPKSEAEKVIAHACREHNHDAIDWASKHDPSVKVAGT